MAAEFEFLDDVQKPFKNKKLKPFLIAGVVLVVAVVLLKGNSRASSPTEYIGTYASNTGATTEVSNMMEQQKETITSMLDTQSEQYSSQMDAYMSQLNAMFDSNMNAYDYQWQQKLQEYENQLKQLGTGTVGGVNSGSSSSGSIAENNDLVVRQPSTGSSGRTENKKGSGLAIVPEWRESGSNSPEDNGGKGYITAGWVSAFAGDMGGTQTSESNLSGKNYYYESATGVVHDSPIKTMTSQSSSKDYTSAYDGGHVGAGITETIITREDGTRVVTWTPNKNK